MASPASGTTIRPELGQGYLELDLMAQLQGLIGFNAMPLMPSARESGVFPKVSLETLLPKVSLDKFRRGTDGAYTRDAWEYTSDNFTCEEYGKEEPVDDRSSAILSHLGLMNQQIAADRSVSMLLRALEASVEAIVYDATTYSSQFNAVTNEWDDAANATPITDVKGAIENFEERNGFGPNLLVMNRKQARNVLLTSQVQTVLGYRPNVGASGEQLQGNLMASVLAAVLGVPRVVISGSFENSALPGGTASLSRQWSDEYVALLYASDGLDLQQPSFGRIFSYVGEAGGGGGSGAGSVVIESYREERTRGDIIRARFDLDVKVVHSELLEGLSNITT